MDINKQLILVEIANKYWEAELNKDQEGMNHWKDLMDKVEQTNVQTVHLVTLKTSFLAMMYVAREEGLVVEDRYYELEDHINNNEDLSLTDMMDNLENVYRLINGN